MPFPSLTYKIFTFFFFLSYLLARDKELRALEDDGTIEYEDSGSLNCPEKGHGSNTVLGLLHKQKVYYFKHLRFEVCLWTSGAPP